MVRTFCVIIKLSSKILLKPFQHYNSNYYLTYYAVKFVKIIFSININSGKKIKIDLGTSSMMASPA